MTEIFAVKPDRGHVVHLQSPGYQPGKKSRSVRDSSSLCNVGIARQETVPLAEALRWPNPEPATALRAEWPWVWCRECIGHAVALVGMSVEVIADVSARAVAS